MAQPLTIVIFGASGDLTWRKLIPALFNLSQKGKLPPEARIVGVARTAYSDDDYRKELEPKVKGILPGEQFNAAKWAGVRLADSLRQHRRHPAGRLQGAGRVVQGQRGWRERPPALLLLDGPEVLLGH